MVPFAVTLSDLIEKGGAYVGIAAFFGLAVLTVLYFAAGRHPADKKPVRALSHKTYQQKIAALIEKKHSRRPSKAGRIAHTYSSVSERDDCTNTKPTVTISSTIMPATP